MSKTGKNRSLSICLSDIPKDKILKHENGKLYLNLSTYDLDEPDQYKNDFNVSVQLTKEEIERKKAGEKVDRVFLGNGRIWQDVVKIHPASEDDTHDLPF